MALLQPVHTWHDAAILVVLLLVWYVARSLYALSNRVTSVSLPKRQVEIRFKTR